MISRRALRVSHALNPAGFEPRIPHVSNSGFVPCVSFPHITCELACIMTGVKTHVREYKEVSDQVIRENPASRGTETSSL